MPGVVTLDPLVDRDRELAVVRGALAGLSDRKPGVLVVTGPCGVGAGVLVRRGCELADQLGVRVAYARGSRFESGLDFGLASQLSARVAGPGRPRWGNDLAAVLCEEVLAAVRQAPLLIAVEDAHFIDSGSARWLSAVVRRMSGLPLVFLLSVAAGTDREAVLRGLADRVVRPRPLGGPGVRELLVRTLGGAVEDSFAAAVAQATGGYPSVVRAVAHRVAAARLAPTAAGVPRMRGMATEALGQRLSRLLDGLPDELVDLVHVIAVAGDNLDFELVCSVAGLRGMSAAAARSRLRAADLVTDDPRPVLAGWVPVDRVLARGARTRADGSAVHAVVAELCHRGAVPDSAVAGILLGGGPVGAPWAVDVLRAAAAGAPADAAALLRRALREPVDRAQSTRLLFDLGQLELATSPLASNRRLAQVITAPAGPDADVLRVRAADLVLSRGDHALVRRLTGAVVKRADISAQTRDRLLALHWLSRDRLRETADVVGGSVEEPVPDDPSDPAQAAAVAWRITLTCGDADRARELARAALRPTDPDACPASLRITAAAVLDLTGETAAAADALAAVLAGVRLPHDRATGAHALLVRAALFLRHGRVDEAARDLRAAGRMLPEGSWHPHRADYLEALRLIVRLRRGAPGAALRRLDGAGHTDCALLRYARGLVLLADMNFSRAADVLVECGRMLMNSGLTNPLVLPWHPAAASALRVLGDGARADRLDAEHEALTRAWQASTP
ncbi:ATP-binding protein [Actinokineospora sp. G85]|uniref:ATP-binding protein n=1 Tax=Actinokineospora sp. G85 TaxID=3406626 RepID=UPI003C78E57E